MQGKAAQILVAVLTIFSLGLIVRAGFGVLQAYGVGASNAFKLGPNPSLLEDLLPLDVNLGFIIIALAAWLASQHHLSPVFSARLRYPVGGPTGR